MNDKKSNDSRRKLLKSLAVGSGAVVAGKSLPEAWTKPIVNSVILPAHAETSFAFNCSIPFEVPFATVNETDGIAGGYSGTQSAAGPFQGNCAKTAFEFSELGLSITVSNIVTTGPTTFTANVLYELLGSPAQSDNVSFTESDTNKYVGNTATKITDFFTFSGDRARREEQLNYIILLQQVGTTGNINMIGAVIGNILVNEL